MANETDIGQADGGLGFAVGAAIVQFNKVAVLPGLVNMVPCVKGSNKARIPVYTKLGIGDVATRSSGTEGQVSRKEIVTTAKDAEALRNHIDTLITDLAVHGNADALLVNAGAAIGNAVALEFDTQALQFVDEFGNTAGANTTGMSMQKLFAAVAKLEENSAPRPYACVLHPMNMWGDFGITNEIGSAGAVNESNGALNGGSVVGDTLRSSGFVANLGGVSIHTSPAVSKDDGAGTAQGGVFAKTAIGCGYIDFGGGNFIQIESQRNAPYAATELVANGYFGFIEAVDSHGCTLLNQM